MNMADAAIFFQEDGFAARSDRIVGRPVSGLGLLRAAAHAVAPGPLTLYGADDSQLDQFIALQGREDVLAPNQAIAWCGSLSDKAIADVGTVYLHGMGLLSDLAWRRRRLGQSRFSLCGIHHTISTHDAIDAIGGLLTAPLTSWDALICTSRAAKSAIETILDGYGDYLKERFQAHQVPRIELPIIPLGVWCDQFDVPAPRRRSARDLWRARLGAGEDDAVILSFGRLSHLGKAHPIPLFLALDRIPAGRGAVHLVMAGWFPNDTMQGQFMAAAATLCPAIEVHWLDGRLEDLRQEIWHAADIFVSLSDTIQESFGLTPVEAMAAGLPCVVSDWDGYRDTVIDGVTGFRIPTIAPADGAGVDLAAWYEAGLISPDGYEGFTALATAVDVGAAATALGRLVSDMELRATMADAARRHARATFDWPVVYSSMRGLWGELAARRAAAGEVVPAQHPLRPDPFGMFASYPTATLASGHQVRRADFPLNRLGILLRMDMATYGGDVLGLNALALDVLGHVGAVPVTVEAVLANYERDQHRQVILTLGVLLKFGLLRM